MIFDIKEKSIILTQTFFLAIATNIPQRLKTGFVVQRHICCVTYDLEQWYSNLARKIHFPAEFSSNSDQTHLPVIF